MHIQSLFDDHFLTRCPLKALECNFTGFLVINFQSSLANFVLVNQGIIVVKLCVRPSYILCVGMCLLWMLAVALIFLLSSLGFICLTLVE